MTKRVSFWLHVAGFICIMLGGINEILLFMPVKYSVIVILSGMVFAATAWYVAERERKASYKRHMEQLDKLLNKSR